MKVNDNSSRHRWKFFRAGGVDQVALRDGADILNLPSLDQKLWVALACPTRGIEFDKKTLDLMDLHGDGRIRVPEVLATVHWASRVFSNLDELVRGRDSVPLAQLNDKIEEGGAVLAGARRILQNLGKPDANSISLEEVTDTVKIFAKTTFNGDGIVPVGAAPDVGTQQAIQDIITTLGGVTDRSGAPGVDQAQVEAFFTEAAALCAWHAAPGGDRKVLPLGENTSAGAAAVQRLKVKLDDYFARCRLAAFDSRAVAALNGSEAEFAALASKELTMKAEDIAKLPLARIEAGKPLNLLEGLNPAWSAAVADLRLHAVVPLFGEKKASLSETEWQQLQETFAPFQAWMAARPTTALEKLGISRVQALLADGSKQRILDLIQQDAALAGENARLKDVEKAVRIFRDLYRFLNNFVNFSDFYSRKGAVFQAGTLYLDGRSCGLCLPVADPGKHAVLAGLSANYLAYLDCTRSDGEKMSIVAAFTGGDSDHLMVGRNGVFYDRKGRDWDATITKIVSNPISIREAFWAPYKKFVRMIEEQIAKRATDADAQSQKLLTGAATSVANADKKTEKPLEAKKIDVGTVAAIGVAIGGIGAMVTGVLAAFFGLGAWMPIGLLGVLLLISGPSMLLAYLKLRQRNLGPILDANGWAINGRARINVPFGGALTSVAALPPGSERSLQDPYAEKRRPWGLYAALLIIGLAALGWYLGKLDRFLPGSAKSTAVLGTNAPAYKPVSVKLEAPVKLETQGTPAQ